MARKLSQFTNNEQKAQFKAIMGYLGDQLAKNHPDNTFYLTEEDLHLCQTDVCGNVVEEWWIEFDDSDSEAFLITTHDKVPLGDPKSFEKIMREYDDKVKRDRATKIDPFSAAVEASWNDTDRLVIFSKEKGKYIDASEFNY
jgi:hypothetical protein